MRSDLLVVISSAAVAAAVAGSANAGLASAFDPFTAASTGTTSPGHSVSGSYMGGFFTNRALTASGTSGTGSSARTLTNSIGSGILTVNVAGPNSGNSTRSGNAIYTRSADGDLSNFDAISVTIAYTTFTGKVSFTFYGSLGTDASWVNDEIRNEYTGTVTLTFSKADFDGTVDWTKVSGFNMGFSSKPYVAGSALISNFSYTMVPAPGAAALIGAAGMISGRRRKA